MDEVKDCDSLENLQRLVESEVWKDHPELVKAIFLRYSELTATGDQESSNFGTPAFRDALLDEYGMDEDDDRPGVSGSPMTLPELQQWVEYGYWMNDINYRNQLLDRYLQLCRGQRFTNFGTNEFWSSIFDGGEQETGVVNHDDQEGHGVRDREGDHTPLPEGGQAGAIEIVPSDYYELHPMFTKSTKRFRTEYGQYDLVFKNMENVPDVELVLLAIFTDVLETIKADGDDGDLLSFFLQHPVLDIPIVIPLRRQGDFTAGLIVDEICKVLQSKTDLTFDDKMTVYFTRIKRPAGSGVFQRKYCTNLDQYLKKKRAIIEIVNNDNLCCARAIVTAKARIDSDRYETVRKGDRDRNSLQRERAQALMETAGLRNHQGSCGPEEWMALQSALGVGQYQLKIFDKDTFGGLVYVGPDAPKVLHLWLYEDHFHVITSPASFFEQSYFCESCNKAYEHRIDHQICPTRCHCCFSMGKCNLEQPLKKCSDCHRFFYNEQCFLKHLQVVANDKNKKDARPVCNQLRRCESCRKEYYTRKGHQCGVRQCPTCKTDVTTADHQCFIQPYMKKGINEEEDPLEEEEVSDRVGGDDDSTIDAPPPAKKQKVEEHTSFIFYDFECRQDESIGQNECGDINLHQPNLVIAHKVCEQCCHLPIQEQCSFCIDKRKIFEDDGCLDKFCEWLFSKKNKNSIAIAHNAKGYDGQFILEYCHRRGLKPRHIIARGLGIMYLEVGNIKFKDSLNFIPMALSAMPKAFDIQECKKGFFPHMFNRKENWNYVGAWPAVDFYQPQYMKDGDRKAFMDWYEQQRGKQFDFQREIKEYCESDVDVLRRCALKFRQLFMDIGQIDPFVESITIASACNKYYRMHHLPVNRIAIVPHGGYRKEQRQSVIALKWLKWIAHTSGQRIQHKLNGGEAKIGQWYVDGICGTTIYEFYGCYWHGCPKCMTKRGRVAADGVLTASEAYQRTMDRRQGLEALGYTVEEKWECQLNAELKQDKEMATFFSKVKIVEPLDAREAFFGGRTNATVLYHKVGTGEQIKYIDVLSLYPYICKYGRFPTGHPTVITENFEPMDEDHMPYEGLVKCKVLPPRDLLHPVLPFRCNNKLMFPLCGSCAANCQQEPCQHSDEERALSGAWVTLELKKALELGYRILETYEVWHFENYEQYDPATNPDGGLFAAYINDFLRIKQEADGWPSGADTDEKKQAFLDEWKRREGLELRPDRMTKNSGLRALAKLMLNSFWGKFGQRSKLSKTEYFTDPAEFFKLVFDPATCTKTVRIVNDKMVAVNYDLRDEFVEVLANTNTVIAAYTTAQARLKLYSYIERLQDRVLYFDTDSIIYVDRIGDHYRPETGNFLGEMTDELEKDFGSGSFITEFVSGGPKHYAFKVWSTAEQKEKICMKVKGFRITHDISAEINFENLREKVHAFVRERDRQETIVHINRIERTADRNVVTVIRKKVYRVTYDKRVILSDFSTVPYGFRRDTF